MKVSTKIEADPAAQSSPAAPPSLEAFSGGSWNPFNAGVRRWLALKLEQKFLIVAALAVALSMIVLGYWIERRVRSGWVQGIAETGALYLEGFLAPHVQGLDGSRTLSIENRDEIKNLLIDTSLGDRVAIIKIWDLDGNLIFSTKTESHEKLNPTYIKRIKAGQVVVNDDDHHIVKSKSGTAKTRLIEIYAPIYKQKTKQIIAIGEFYEDNQFLSGEIYKIKYMIWFSILIILIFIIAFLYISVRRVSKIVISQQLLLEANLVRAGSLAKHNNTLRRAANRARLNAVLLNETYLASVGSDIHDGPVQILSLMMLKLPDTKQPKKGAFVATKLLDRIRMELEPLIQQTLGDLRDLSSGLVLPEIDNLSTMETIELAIVRHEQHTGTIVVRELSYSSAQVPSAIRVCSYRIVQEALNNAYKHAGGREQRVSVQLLADTIDIRVTDGGAAPSARTPQASSGSKLGLKGMESRIRILRGSLAVFKLENGGMAVRASLPLRP